MSYHKRAPEEGSRTSDSYFNPERTFQRANEKFVSAKSGVPARPARASQWKLRKAARLGGGALRSRRGPRPGPSIVAKSRVRKHTANRESRKPSCTERGGADTRRRRRARVTHNSPSSTITQPRLTLGQTGTVNPHGNPFFITSDNFFCQDPLSWQLMEIAGRAKHVAVDAARSVLDSCRSGLHPAIRLEVTASAVPFSQPFSIRYPIEEADSALVIGVASVHERQYYLLTGDSQAGFPL
ncbi:hypothetical protein EVAR_96713_1 [Eumeta japonica]|uniref:Uncharacterized protein n=1 Tax=Eumeta variegata TaxID=151549 RepID=A0A4C1WGB5_EUMVA|nr:hypothetical protein EVAR_96713_1 [Eumeta japonica]